MSATVQHILRASGPDLWSLLRGTMTQLRLLDLCPLQHLAQQVGVAVCSPCQFTQMRPRRQVETSWQLSRKLTRTFPVTDTTVLKRTSRMS